MPEESVPTTETTPPLPNSPEARTPDGTLKDTISTAPTPETTPSESVTEPKTDGPPESYDFKAPEGKELNSKFLDRATPVFKELGLSQANAQKLVDTYNELVGDT